MARSKQYRRIFNEELVVQYQAVYRFLLRMCGNEADANDLTQDTFERAYRKIEQFQPGTNGRAWLYRIAQNLFINQYRKTVRRGEQPLEDEREAYHRRDESRALAAFADLRASGALDADFYDPVVRALALLTDEQRAIILMSDLQDFAEKEIAEALELNLNTVKGKIRRARIALIKRLGGYAEDNYGIVNTRNF